MDSFISQIIMWAGTYAPRGWAWCDGRTMAVNENSALFSLIGTTYGGDGIQTFNLPDLRGRVPAGITASNSPETVRLGDRFGTTSISLTEPNLPSHDHEISCFSPLGDQQLPVNGYHADEGHSEYGLYKSTQNSQMASTGVTGASQGFPVNQPSSGIGFIISLDGIYPSRP